MNPLEEENFLWLEEKGSERESKHEESLTYYGWVEDGGMGIGSTYDKEFGYFLEAESSPWATANKKTETSLLQHHGSEFW